MSTESYHLGMQWASSIATMASSFPKGELLKIPLHGGEMALQRHYTKTMIHAPYFYVFNALHLLTKAKMSNNSLIEVFSTFNSYSWYPGIIQLLYLIKNSFIKNFQFKWPFGGNNCGWACRDHAVDYLTHACWSIKPLSGLITTPTALVLITNGTRYIHNFPVPVPIFTSTSCHACSTGIKQQAAPGKSQPSLKCLVSASLALW